MELEQLARQIITKALQGLTVEEAKTFTVTDANSKRLAATRRDLAKAAIDRVEEVYGKHVKTAHKAWKDLLKDKNTAMESPEFIQNAYRRTPRLGFNAKQIIPGLNNSQLPTPRLHFTTSHNTPLHSSPSVHPISILSTTSLGFLTSQSCYRVREMSPVIQREAVFS